MDKSLFPRAGIHRGEVGLAGPAELDDAEVVVKTAPSFMKNTEAAGSEMLSFAPARLPVFFVATIVCRP
jgi:hypothetical protein